METELEHTEKEREREKKIAREGESERGAQAEQVTAQQTRVFE